MQLNDLLASVKVAYDGDVWVEDITDDSREVRPGSCFFAVPGSESDGRLYINDALLRGAVAIIYDNDDGFDGLPSSVPSIPIAHLSMHLGMMAAHFFAHPSRSMSVYAVTGTNGKSSCVHAIAHALKYLGKRCWQVGTLGYGFQDHLQEMGMTTPGAIRLQRILHEARLQGADAVAMEVSSHALDQGRIHGVSIDVALLTQVTQDHLDYHLTQASYESCKKRLFEIPLQVAVYNLGDRCGAQWIKESSATCSVGYFLGGKRAGAWSWQIEHEGSKGLDVVVQAPCGQISQCHIPLIGAFNAANLAAVTAALVACGYEQTSILKAWQDILPVRGRMNVMTSSSGVQVVVDYAHTQDALGAALKSLRGIAQGKLWCVFGCGGERDQGKRPLMLSCALEGADRVVMTSDNPRGEDPKKIINDMIAGRTLDDRVVSILLDRSEAIGYAISHAQRGDVILIAGKGHESYQLIGRERHYFSDTVCAKNFMGL